MFIIRVKPTIGTDEPFAHDLACQKICRAPDLKLGASVRASIDTAAIYREVLRIAPVAGPGDTGPLAERLLLQSAMMAFRNRIWIYETSEKTSEQIIQEIFFSLRKPQKKKTPNSSGPDIRIWNSC